MKCRSEKLREELVKIYDIKPIAHVKLLKGQEKVSCTGDLLTDSYYCFSYKKKNTGDPLQSFFCGSHGSKDFLRLLGLKPLTCFNPIKGDGLTGVKTGGSRVNSDIEKWDQTAKELYNALNLLIVYWDIAPNGAILDIKSKVEKDYYKVPGDSTIKAVNTILSKDKNNNTMTMIVNLLGKTHDVRDFKFEDINKRLKEMDLKSYF